MSDTTHTMDVSITCGICERTWSLNDATMANYELLHRMVEEHTHSIEEMQVVHDAYSSSRVNYQDDTEDDL